jgi:hypothetical protein
MMRRLAVLLPLLFAGPALAASPTDADLPCVQRKVPELSVAAIWTGPAVEGAARTWADDPTVAALVERIASRRVPVEEAEEAVAGFSAALPAEEREAKLTAVFAGLFERLNRERMDVMAGIERYGRKQKALADAIRKEAAALSRLRASGGTDPAAVTEQEDKLVWDTRIFNERRASLTYVCEVPVLIEQRLGRLARAIGKGLGGP